ncbi:MAG: quinone oxidoreductase [Gemmatimonadetes bacterium]|nr:quinone oxidoreductase [Gemmatimonadota bacterium]
MRAVRVSEHGGPEVLRLEELPLPQPGAGEARVRIALAGVNYIDVYQRTGLYPQNLPFTPGSEAAGVVDAVGARVTGVHPGDRVAYATTLGSYAEYAIVPAASLVPVPEGIDLAAAAALLLQGLTAHYLTQTTVPLQPGQTVLVHAAAGGVGLLLVQLARRRGARVLATVSTEAKAELARSAGAAEAVLYTREDFPTAARRFTGGRGLDVVYDGVGRSTFEGSLDSLRPRGMLVLYGQASGAVPPLDPLLLARKGSLFLTRPVLGDYLRDRAELLDRARDLFGWLEAGEVRVRIDRVLPLAEAAEAHRLLEARSTAGKLLLECVAAPSVVAA